MSIKVLPGYLVWWTGDSHGDRNQDESQMSGQLLWEEGMKVHFGRRGSLDENVIHVSGYQDPPSHFQEGHNRLKDPR